MNEDYIAISTLNDFIFCPYSIYLHNVYVDTDTDMYQALPQIKGKEAHKNVDTKNVSSSNSVLESLNVVSHEYGIKGKIDIFDVSNGRLTERKNSLKNIYQGQIYQLWAQFLCLKEMGYEVKSMCFYEITTRKHFHVAPPDEADLEDFTHFISKYRAFNPGSFMPKNPNKCSHCIYCGLCDKYIFENVY